MKAFFFFKCSPRWPERIYLLPKLQHQKSVIPHQARLKVGGDVCGQFQRPDLEEAPRSGDGLTVRDEVTGSDMSQPRQCHRGQPSCVKTPCTTNPNTGYALVHSFWDYDSKCVPSVCLSEHPLHLAAAQLNTTLGGQAF